MTTRPLHPTRFGTPVGRRGAPSNLPLLCKNSCRSSARIVDVDHLWLVVMTANQCLALAWLLGYAFIKDWTYASSSGDTISALYFGTSAIASSALVYKFRDRLQRTLT